MRTIARIIGLLSLLPLFAVAAETAPDALVKSTVEEVLAVLKDTKDKRKLVELAEQKLNDKARALDAERAGHQRAGHRTRHDGGGARRRTSARGRSRNRQHTSGTSEGAPEI